MAGFEIKKTELVWPGKYDEQGRLREVDRVTLPFQVIESINQSRPDMAAASKPKQRTLFDMWEGKEGATFDTGWKNKLIWGDNKLVMASLLEKFAGKIDLIYIDPPFATGTDFSFVAQVGEGDVEISKEQSLIEEKAYRDTWGRGLESYLSMMAKRFTIMRELLKATGTIFVHIDWRVSHWVRALMDEVFGADNFLNEIVWYHTIIGAAQNRYPKSHEVLLWYASDSSQSMLDTQSKYARVPYKPRITDNLSKDERGYYYTRGRSTRKASAEEIKTKAFTRTYVDIEKGKVTGDVWDDIPTYRVQGDEYLGYPTQKPEKLLERVVGASSQEGGLVADFFCGSGSTLAVAERLGRRWIGCDLSRFAIHTTRKRLLAIEGCKPFEVLNLGKYERQYWQGVTFGTKNKTVSEQALFEYLAFILRVYGAEPVTGMEHLHGKKGKAVVHIGAVDAPVTIDEINAAVEECLRLKRDELHVLGWEWEMGIVGGNPTKTKAVGPIQEEASKRGVKLILLSIPREVMEKQAVDKGDVQFFELAYLEAKAEVAKNREVRVALKDFVLPNTELIPEDVRSKIKKWSDYIDYWAVDWDFQNDTFMNGWVAYRTRQDRTLVLESDPHNYKKPGTYRIMVKVVDIFGNDTSRVLEVEVK